MHLIRLSKEVRQIFWPWTMLLLFGLTSLIRFPWTGDWRMHSLTEAALPGALFLGVSLLSALPLGAEFQHRTISLSLAQPVPRQDLWRMKLMVTLAAVLSLVLVCGFSLWKDLRFLDDAFWAFGAAVWIVLTTAGGIFWTLQARSTIGGMVLNACGLAPLQFAWLYLRERFSSTEHVPWFLIWSTVPLALIYSAVLLWLGRRKLLAFQATEGMQASETAIPGTHLVPHFILGWLRCRPTQPLGNLVRRELRLLRVVWPLSVLSLVSWIFLVGFHLLPRGSGRPSTPSAFALVMTVVLSMLISILCGVLSLGEERTWGTHEWQMTLPISSTAQWLVKLGVAIASAVMCASVLPIAVLLAGGWLQGSVRLYVSGGLVWLWPLEAAIFAAVAFWCASLIKGAVRAALCFFPLAFAFALAGNLGNWCAEFVASHGLVERMVAWVGPFSFNRLKIAIIYNAGFKVETLLIVALLPLFAVGLIQSHRWFRAESSESRLRVVRCAVPLLGLGLVFTFAVALLMLSSSEAWRQQADTLREAHTAIEVLQPQMKIAGPQRLRLKDLEGAAPLSERTRRWLQNAAIFVVPGQLASNSNAAHTSATGGVWQLVPGAPGKAPAAYSAVIRSVDGEHNCSLTYVAGGTTALGTLGAICD
jgi:hypothetical protein